MKERYVTASKDNIPEDKTITQVYVDFWSHELAEAVGFPDLVPDREPDVSFYVGIGANKDYAIVGAKLLSKEPVNFEDEHWVKQRREAFLMLKARKAFGLVDDRIIF